MPRRSKRLKEKMSTDEGNTPVGSPAESDNEKTMIEKKEPSVAELKEEILSLKNSLKQLLDVSNNLSTSAATETQLPVVTTLPNLLPGPSTVPPAVAASNLYSMSNTTTTPASTTPMHQQKVNICEYTMPFRYNLPYTAPCSFTPTTTSLPYYATQSLPYTVAQPFVPTTTTMPFLPTSVDFLQQRSQQMLTAQPRMTPVTSSYLPTHATSSSLNMPELQSANEFRPLRKLHDLPQFSGQPEQWPMFIVAYKETTTNYNYSNLENLIRLQKCLKGDARAKVEAFLIHPDSVKQVVSTLEFCYGRPQVLIRSQIAKVRSFPSISE